MDASDDLDEFFELIETLRIANIKRFPAEYLVLRRINKCLTSPGEHLEKASPFICGVLFLRCQYSYKAAAGMSLSGQVTETFQMMRACLEYAGYALTIFDKPELEAVWIARNDTTESMRAQKNAFRVTDIRAAVQKFDARLGEIFQDQYERVIDFGGHPNPHATMSTIDMTDLDKTGSFSVNALSVERNVLLHALRNTAQVGLTALHIFQHIYPEKFELLGVMRIPMKSPG